MTKGLLPLISLNIFQKFSQGKSETMKEKNHFKKILALMLVLVLSINQFSVVLYAQEESSLEDFTSSDESEAEANVEADDSGFSDGTDLSDAPPK